MDLGRLEEVYHGARAIPGGTAREAFLDRVCAADAPLREEAEAMLRADAEAELLLRACDADESRAGADGLAGERSGDRIGAFTILEQIGEGGFGAVYMAEQREPVVRRVALKVLKPGLDTRQVIARFEAERQALALMDHPNISRVLEAGATAAGRPYFVMELIHGEPITLHCDRHRLPVPRRLALFLQVCAAVQHAHGKGIVHRDIKPGNVIVSLGGGVASPKVIDFGIAKAVGGGPLTDKTMFTALGRYIGTPAYMSPEQASASPDIDTRSDVYSLGALLYELLTGVAPFDPEMLRRATPEELGRIIREVDPPRPSTRLATLTGAGRASSLRGAEPRRLGSLLRGELDWIVMRAIEKDRGRRYQTPAHLADDVLAFLENRPVAASPASARYIAAKFVRRHRAAVAAGGLVATALVLGAIGTAAGLVEADRASALLAERNAHLEAVAAFQQSQLSGVDVAALGRDLREELLGQARAAARRAGRGDDQAGAAVDTLSAALAPVNFTTLSMHALERGVFRRALEAIDARFSDQPLLRARLLQATAETMHSLGLIDGARGPQAAALALREQHLGPEHPDTIESRMQAAHLLNSAGDFTGAERAYRGVLALGPAVNDRTRIQAARLVGAAMLDTGRLADAESALEGAAAEASAVLGDDHADTLAALNALGRVRSQQGNFEQAEELYRRVLEGRRRTLGEDHPQTLQSLSNMGVILHRLGRPVESERFVRRSLERHRAALGGEHPATLNALHSMAGMLASRGRLEEAESAYLEALALAERLYGPSGSDTLTMANGLGELRRLQNRPEEAEALFVRAAQGRLPVHGPTHRLTIDSHRNLGVLRLEAGRPAEAVEPLRLVHKGLRETMPPDHPRAAQRHSAALLLAEALAAQADAVSEPRGADATRLLEEARDAAVPAAEWALGAARPGEVNPGEAASLVARVYEALHALHPEGGFDAQAEAWRGRASSR